jgi:hypothetical protein
MQEPKMRARVSLLHKTETEWNSMINFVPLSGEFIIFDPDETHDYARIKVGDGKTKLKDLPFFIDSAVDTYVTKNRFNEIIDAGRVTDYKN